MNHEEIRFHLAAYLARRLPEAESSQMDAHLAMCDDCEDLVSSLRVFGDAVARHGDALFDPHPAPGDLERVARGEPVHDMERLQRHLAVCAACQLEMEGPPSPARSEGRSAPATPVAATPLWVRAGKAASLLAAGLAAGLLLDVLVERRQPSWNGPIDLPVLNRMTRSEAPITRILARPGQKALVIALPLEAPGDRPETETLQLQVLATDGSAVYTLREPLGRLRHHADSSGIIPLMIESRRLPLGRYEVILTGAGGPQDLIAVNHFEVVAGGTGTDSAASPED